MFWHGLRGTAAQHGELAALIETITDCKAGIDAIRGAYGLAPDRRPAALLSLVRRGHEHPAYEHYLEWLQLEAAREEARAECRALLERL